MEVPGLKLGPFLPTSSSSPPLAPLLPSPGALDLCPRPCPELFRTSFHQLFAPQPGETEAQIPEFAHKGRGTTSRSSTPASPVLKIIGHLNLTTVLTRVAQLLGCWLSIVSKSKGGQFDSWSELRVCSRVRACRRGNRSVFLSLSFSLPSSLSNN